MPDTPSTFRRSLPVTLTSFINKAGTIGLSVVPILLVEKHIPSDQSAYVMATIKIAGLVGILLGGRLCDRIGLRATLLLSFVVAGLGMLPLPFAETALLLALLSGLSQLGTSFYYASARLLVTQLVGPADRAEAIAWQRTGNNLAQILSYSMGAFLGGLGTSFLLLFDAGTSFLAAGVGAKILPPGKPVETVDEAGAPTGSRAKRHFYQGALIVAAFTFLYEIYMVAAAAKCKILFGTQGLQIFSQMMVLNTFLCAIFSIYAARHLKNARVVLPSGVLFLGLGLLATFAMPEHKRWFFVGSLLATLGEIVFNALSGMVLIVITPAGKKQAATYSNGVLMQFIGRIAGASAAFPLIVHGTHPTAVISVALFAALILCFTARGVLSRVH